jgi:hypothetical protein
MLKKKFFLTRTRLYFSLKVYSIYKIWQCYEHNAVDTRADNYLYIKLGEWLQETP